jgi:hypothetical protein
MKNSTGMPKKERIYRIDWLESLIGLVTHIAGQSLMNIIDLLQIMASFVEREFTSLKLSIFLELLGKEITYLDIFYQTVI